MEIVFAPCLSNRCKVAACCPGQGANLPGPGEVGDLKF